jgi:type I restriction enzyme S subunit
MPDINMLITDNINIWSSAVQSGKTAGRGKSKKRTLQGVKKLRELILELAVHGKLVPQNTSDEKASKLLEKITEKKQQLVKQKLIKKPKVLPAITKSEEPFSLPDSWVWCRLQDLSSYIQRGKGPEYDDNGKVKVVSQKCIQWSGFDVEPARFVNDESIENYQEERFLQQNDLLWNSTGTGTVGRINVLDKIKSKSLVADSHVTIIRSLLPNPYFIWIYISAPGIQLRIEPEHENALVSGSTKQVELNTSSVTSLEIPLPPLEEQNRIVTKVEELMALCDQLEQQTESSIDAHQLLVQELLSTLTNSQNSHAYEQSWARIAEHFDLLFTTENSIEKLKQTILQLAVMGKLVSQDPNDEPASKLLKKIAQGKAQLVKDKKIKKPKKLISFEGLDNLKKPIPLSWEWIKLDNVADIVRGGSPRPAGDPKFYDGSIPFLKVGDITRKSGKFVEGFNATIKEAGLQKTRLIETRTVLLSNSGATLGVPAICDFSATFNDGIAAFVEKSNYITDDYLYFYLSTLTKWFLDIASRGQGQPNLNTDIIKTTWFALPPVNEQHRIVTRVDSLIELCNRLIQDISEVTSTEVHLAEAVVEQTLS